MWDILLVYNKVMRINVHEAKVGLSAYLKRAQGGERIIICNRNVPVAELKPVRPDEVGEEATLKPKRVLGFAAGQFVIPESFYEPMTEEELAEWEGPVFAPHSTDF
jgi:antitoxin (DNA-binding transcriptional repressor) of toxin-antitoxin stability system